MKRGWRYEVEYDLWIPRDKPSYKKTKEAIEKKIYECMESIGEIQMCRLVAYATVGLYWVTTEDHGKDWFILAEAAAQARTFHLKMEGYWCGNSHDQGCEAERITDFEYQLHSPLDPACHTCGHKSNLECEQANCECTDWWHDEGLFPRHPSYDDLKKMGFEIISPDDAVRMVVRLNGRTFTKGEMGEKVGQARMIQTQQINVQKEHLKLL